jgi:tetratricopeptide (TPR) repeat protein
MSHQGKRGRKGGSSSGSGSDAHRRNSTAFTDQSQFFHDKKHPQAEQDVYGTPTFGRHSPTPASVGNLRHSFLVERREAARRRLARAVRRALKARPEAAKRLPATAAYGRFADLAAAGAAAEALHVDAHSWHRVHLQTLPPEGLERELAHLVASGDRVCAIHSVRQLATGLRLSGAADGMARVRYWLAVLAPPGRPGPALRRLRQALPVAISQGDRERSARILGQLGRLYAAVGRFREAYSRLRAALDLAEDLGLDPVLHAAMYINLGNVLVSMGHSDRAETPYQRSLDLAVEGGAEPVAMLAREGLRYMEEQRGNLAQAYLYGSAVLAWRRRVGPPSRVRWALVNLARIAHELHPAGRDALALLAEADGFEGTAMDQVAHQLCEAAARIAHHEEARAVALIDAVEDSLRNLAGAASNQAAFHVAYMRAELLLSRGEVSGAYEWYRAAAHILASYPGRNTDIPPYLRSALVAGMTAAAQAVGRTEEAAVLAAEMARAGRPEPLPADSTVDVVREELTLTGAGSAESGVVIFLSQGAARRSRRRR